MDFNQWNYSATLVNDFDPLSQALPMISLNDQDPVHRSARNLSKQLGTLAAEQHPDAALPPFDPAAPGISPRLASILEHFRKRAMTREHAAHKLKFNEFMAGS
jgi:hypothetical protein